MLPHCGQDRCPGGAGGCDRSRALFEANGNRCRPGSVRIKIMSPIQTAGMSKAEQKQLPDAVRQSILAALK